MSNAIASELDAIVSRRELATPIAVDEYLQRLQRVRDRMREANCDVLYLDASSSLYYFTGLHCYRSERLHGALITADDLTYVCPAFEEQKTRASVVVEGDFLLWQEHDDPVATICAIAPTAT